MRAFQLPCQHPPRRTSRSPQFLVPVTAPRRAGRPGAPRRISRSWRGIDLHPRPTRLGAELRLRRRRLLCLWDTSDSTVWRGVWNIFPPFGTCLVIGIQRAGRRRSPTATGSGRGRMDRIGSADRHIPRTSRADRMHMNTDRVMSAIIL